mgnify:CR=1 FL=1
METKVHMRWMIRRDVPDVLDIESKSFSDPWDNDAFVSHLKQRNCIGMVADLSIFDSKVVSYMVYMLHKNKITVINFAVHPDHRYQTIGHQMMRKLKSKLNENKRLKLELALPESNLEGQLFLRKEGFLAVNTIPTQDEDLYMFEFEHYWLEPEELTNNG